MNVTLDTIPTWVPGIILLYTGFIWWVTRKQQIRMDSRIIGGTMIAWGILYILSSLADSSPAHDNIVMRLFMSRVVICLICLAQSMPMTVSYFRGIRRAENGLH